LRSYVVSFSSGNRISLAFVRHWHLLPHFVSPMRRIYEKKNCSKPHQYASDGHKCVSLRVADLGKLTMPRFSGRRNGVRRPAW